MRTVPSGDEGDAVERLQGEQWHILELFDSYARHQRDPAPRIDEAGRLATLIYRLLRVHAELEAMLLRGAAAQQAAGEALLARADMRRHAVLAAVQRAEAMSPHEPAHVQQMAVLAQQVCTWFQADEHEVFGCLRRSRLDLEALDQQMAMQQQWLLGAGRGAGAASAPSAAACA